MGRHSAYGDVVRELTMARAQRRAGASSVAGGLGGFIRSQRHLSALSLRQLAELSSVSNPYWSQTAPELAVRPPPSASRSRTRFHVVWFPVSDDLRTSRSRHALRNRAASA